MTCICDNNDLITNNFWASNFIFKDKREKTHHIKNNVFFTQNLRQNHRDQIFF